MSRLKETLAGQLKKRLTRRTIKAALIAITKDPLFRLLKADFSFEALRISSKFSLDLARKAYTRDQPVCLVSLFSPHELFHALGVVPFVSEVVSAMAAALGFSERLLKEAEGRWHSSDTCGFHRCALGADQIELMPLPDFVVSPSYLCDGISKTLYGISSAHRCEFFPIDIPYYFNDESAYYLASQLKRMSTAIAYKTGQKLDFGRLKEALKLSNATRREMLAVNRLRRDLNLSPKDFNGLSLILPFYTAIGTEAGLQIYETLHHELEAKKANRSITEESGSPQKPLRLLWLHLLPYYQNDILETITRDHRAHLVFEEINYVFWEELDPERPFLSLARKMLSHQWNGPLTRRLEVLKKLALDFRIDGAIHFSHWGCRQSNGAVPIIQDHLAQINVPLLSLEGDCVDDRNYMKGQSNTRIESFLEILEANRC